MKKLDLDATRMFLTSLYSKSIQMKSCKGSVECLEQAEKKMEKEWPVIELLMKRMYDQAEITPEGLKLYSVPMTHELFVDKKDMWIYTSSLSKIKKGFSDEQIKYTLYRAERDRKYEVGRAIFTIDLKDGQGFNIEFEAKDFHHGHMNDDGWINCWGAYKSMHAMIHKEGIMAALSAIYNFAKYSRYGSYDAKEIAEYAGK